MALIDNVHQLTPSVVEGILRHSLSDAALRVLDVSDPEGLGGLNDGYASDLKKIVVTVDKGEGGGHQKINLVIKTSLSSMSTMSVLLGMYVFYREAFWYSTAFPELLKIVNPAQRDALLEMMPLVYHASCNYQEENLNGCLLKRSLLCCCCVLATKPKEKGLILMENLKEGGFVDLKAIERSSGGGVKTSHMRMILQALAQFHGAWMIWMRGAAGMGDKTKEEVLFLYNSVIPEWRWMHKSVVKKVLNLYISVAEAKHEEETVRVLMDVRDSSSTMDKFLKSFDYKDSKFKTMCHKDFWTSQIMFQLKQDGSPSSVKILDYQTLTPGHPAFDIWAIVYSATDAEYRALHLEEDLKAYYTVLSGFMEEQVDFKIFREEVENRRVKGMTMDALSCLLTLSPTKLPSPVREMSKFLEVCKQMLVAEDSPKDHPDIREMRRRVMSNINEFRELNIG